MFLLVYLVNKPLGSICVCLWPHSAGAAGVYHYSRIRHECLGGKLVSSRCPHVVPTALSLQLLDLNSDLHLKAFMHVAARKFWKFFWRSTP